MVAQMTLAYEMRHLHIEARTLALVLAERHCCRHCGSVHMLLRFLHLMEGALHIAQAADALPLRFRIPMEDLLRTVHQRLDCARACCSSVPQLAYYWT